LSARCRPLSWLWSTTITAAPTARTTANAVRPAPRHRLAAAYALLTGANQKLDEMRAP
jgi:hypothetical protein